MANNPLIGRQFANYRIERVLGRGGMAVVYAGTDVVLRRRVAIKLIDARYRDQQAYAERFVQEARAVASWRHENIIQVYYAGEQDGLYYYVMEFIDGPDLARLLEQYNRAGERVPQDDVLRLGRSLASALDYAHTRNVIHRDVKPSNVFIERGGRVVLGDFGIALDTQMGSRGEVFGTAHYIAPEQARASNAAVPQSDLYSLGVILYEMLAGRVPFDDPSPSAIALQHLTLPVPPPSHLNPDLDAGVDAALLKALSKEPGDRYHSGAALVEALENALQGILSDSPPETAPFIELPTHPTDPGLAYNPRKTESQLSLFQRAAEALPAPTTSLEPGGYKERQIPEQPDRKARTLNQSAHQTLPRKGLLPKTLALLGLSGCAVLGLLCLLGLVQSGLLPGLSQAGLPWQRATAVGSESTQAATPESTIIPGPQATATASFPRTDEAAAPEPLDCGPAITVSAHADSWIDQNSASNNFGTDSILKVRSQGPRDNFRALVRFAFPDGMPAGCMVEAATLRLHTASATPDRTLEVLRIADDWSENDVTWENQPETIGPVVTASSGPGTLEWDVTAQVQAIYDTGANYGFLIRDASESGSGDEQQFHSQEKGENPPDLVISFIPGGE
jgi:serine/threonine protein kinase